jgi:AcrR family transcriptional regulator
MARVRLDLEARREQLLAAAFELFVAKAYDEVAVEDVARRAGVSKGLLYHYFPTKKRLYAACVRRGAELLLARTETPADSPPLERLAAGLDAYFTYVADHALAYGALMRSGVGVDQEILLIVEETRDFIAQSLLSGMPLPADGPAMRAAVRGWIGFVEALSLHWIATSSPPRHVLMRLSIDALTAAVTSAVDLDAT